MPPSYEDAVGALYRAPHEAWVVERKRLASELRGAGDKAGAARLLKLGRPPLSAWVVNQLWWREREAFGALLAAAERLRAGETSAAVARREATAALKARAAALLVEAGHGASEGTLRRVTTSLSALAAAGGFEPDLPGTLSADREPPGFDTPGLAEALARSGAAPVTLPAADREANDAVAVAPGVGAAAAREVAEREAAGREARAADEHEAAEREAVAREAVAREAAEREVAEREARLERERLRREQEREARRAERERLQVALGTLRGDRERRQRELERLRAEVARVERLVQDAQAAIAQVERELDALGQD